MRMRTLHAKLTASLLAATVLSGCYKSRPTGFIFPCGGITATPDMPQRVRMSEEALRRLDENRSHGADVGNAVCLVDLRDTPENAEAVRDTFVAAGMNPERFLDFNISTREVANGENGDLVTIRERCGIVYLPGGDQFRQREIWKDTNFGDFLSTLPARGGGLMGNSAGAALLGTLGYYPHFSRQGTDLTTKRLLEGTSYFSEDTGFSEYTEYDDDDNLFTDWARFSAELEPGILANLDKHAPLLYVETHADSRERSARALAVLAAWEYAIRTQSQFAKHRHREPAIAMVVDNDTAPLITFDAKVGGLVAEVFGSRSVEFLIPDSQSLGGATPIDGLSETLRFAANHDGTGVQWTQNAPVVRPYYHNVRSELLLSGGSIVLSGPWRGRILAEGSGRWTANSPKAKKGARDCSSRLPWRILGQAPTQGHDDAADTRLASAIHFTVPAPLNPFTQKPVNDRKFFFMDEDIIAHDPNSDDEENLSRKLDSYLNGQLEVHTGPGCGLWIPQAFSYYGQPRNRLAAARYALGMGHTSLAVLLPWGMTAQIEGTKIRFAETENPVPDPDPVSPWAKDTDTQPSSIMVYDTSQAVRFGISDYVAKEYGFTRPIQTGTWIGGRASLLQPGDTWNLGAEVALRQAINKIQPKAAERR